MLSGPLYGRFIGMRIGLPALNPMAEPFVVTDENQEVPGFWLVKQYLNMSVGETMQSWSVIETIISVTGLALMLALSAAGIRVPRLTQTAAWPHDERMTGVSADAG